MIPRIRAIDTGEAVGVQVGGSAAIGHDFLASQAERMPWAIAITLLATVVVLFLLFGSVVIPLKAVVMTLLSISASFGAARLDLPGRQPVLPLLDFQPLGFTIAGNPIIMFSVIFGLSMDYEVLLLSRIQEAYRRTGDNAQSVAEGLRKDGRRDYGCGVDHGVRLRCVLPRGDGGDQEHRRRDGDRRPRGRHHHPRAAGAGNDAPDGALELVGAGTARAAGGPAWVQSRRGRTLGPVRGSDR